MKTRLLIVTAAMVYSLAASAQTPQVIPLWTNGAPGFEARKDIPEEARDYWVRKINNPTITVFLPPKEKANGTAVVIAPGGGFHELVYENEGVRASEFFNSIGVTAFVLKYRLPGEKDSPYTMDNVRQDAYRAMRLVRSRASEWKINPKRVGMMGFSAGGALVSLVAYTPGDGDPSVPDPIDRLNGKPDFQILVFPGGPEPKTIGPDAPPSFLIVANDDEYGCDKVTLNIFEKLRAAGVRTEAVFLSQGKHAFNMNERPNLLTVMHWPQQLADWMHDSGYLTPSFAVDDTERH
ncbi:MAG: alpha/beta hydrolase [Terracidiphilus sp.]